MVRRRLYNPAQLTPDELKTSFVARKDTLAEMLRLLGEQMPNRPCQHVMLLGPRGMGKTTLGLRFLHAIRETPDLAANWQPVPFDEESYGVDTLADFWITALQHLTGATGQPRWAKRAAALVEDEEDVERIAAYALAALLDFCQATRKRLVLFVESLDVVFAQIRDKRDMHALRATLIERPDILLIGSANAVFDGLVSRGEPFYEFFRIIALDGLGLEDARQILAAIADSEGRPEVTDTLQRDSGRLETICRLTGGNPRLLVLASRVLIESPLGRAFEDLERLVDEQTPYFKARIEALPFQARKVFHCLADGWAPMLAKEVARAAGLGSSHASAQLRQLVNRGYAKEIWLPGASRTRYEVSDRFYNIYYLLRFSRTGRDRLERLVAFLHDLFGPAGMRKMYPAALARLRTERASTEEVSEWLDVLVHHVARDLHYEGRDEWRRGAVDLALNRVGADSPVVGEIERAFALGDAEAICRKIIADRPEHAGAWVLLGIVLVQDERIEDGIAAFEHVLKDATPDDPPESRSMAAGILAYKGWALHKQDRHEEALASCQRAAKYVRPDDPLMLRYTAAVALRLSVAVLLESDRHKEAVAVLARAASYFRVDDPAALRHEAVRVLWAKGVALSHLEQHEESIAVWRQASEYLRSDDPVELRRSASTLLAVGSRWLNFRGKFVAAEACCRRATELDPLHDESWRVLAEGILWQEDERLQESEDCARRAVELAPNKSRALHTLADVLARRGEWTQALDQLEHALRIGGDDFQEQKWPGLTDSLIPAVAAGHGPRVRRIMENAGLVESMEPLWHAIRAELGEELEPLPTEIMETVIDIRQEIASTPASRPG